jgi:adenine-specific DNA methylase
VSRSLLETTFPFEAVSELSAREKNARYGHVSTLHVWWARRPLGVSRAVLFAALIPAPADDATADLSSFIARCGGRDDAGTYRGLAEWRVSATDSHIEKAKDDILRAHGARRPRVLDPLAGGGSFPLEALRLGCDTYASDLNPVAVLMEKATLEYPQRYGSQTPASCAVKGDSPDIRAGDSLLDDVRRWTEWMVAGAQKELGRFYPEDPDGSIPVGYLWARTVRCPNPSCRAEIPLLRQTWLARKGPKLVALRIIPLGHQVNAEIIEAKDLSPEDGRGTVSKANVVCPCCGTKLPGDRVRKEFQDGMAGQRLMAVILHHPDRVGKRYRLADERDVRVFGEAEREAKEKRRLLRERWGIDPVPDELLPPAGTLGFRVQRYGMRTWGDLFNSRQKLALVTFAEKARAAYGEMLSAGLDASYATALATYLGLEVDMAAAFSNMLARWENTSEAIKHLFSRHAVPMVWDYVEANPFSGSSGSVKSGARYYYEALRYCCESSPVPASVSQASCSSLPYPDGFFDLVATDPPYYDNVPYSHLSDFFYVWLKRTVGNLHPELFEAYLSPKSEEIVAYPSALGRADDRRSFQSRMELALREMCRVLKPDGQVIVVFAHKGLDAWEAIIAALAAAGFRVTASWPVQTEMKSRLRARKSAVLGSSVYMVCRKATVERTGFWPDVATSIRHRVRERIDRLLDRGASDDDLLIASIGVAAEEFGRYKRIAMPTGGERPIRQMLTLVSESVAEHRSRRGRSGLTGR